MESPLSAGKNGLSSRMFSRTRYVLIAALSSTLILCLILSWTTRGVVSNAASLHQANADGSTIVDVSPWETAQALASLAVTAEEQDYARQAEHLADHDVDQAFAAALRSAQLQTRHATLSGKAQAIQQRIVQLKQEVLQDQAAVDRLKSAAGSGPKPSGGAAPLSPTPVEVEVAEAQLGLDKDELSDAQRDLAHETGDLSVRIQQELAAREASMRQYDSEQNGGGQIAVVSAETHGTLASRINAWLNQRSRHAMLAQAQAQAENDVRALTLDYNSIDTKMDHESGSGMRASLSLGDLQDRTTQRQILSIIDDRIQTERQLAEVYEKWAAQVILQHRIVLHLILQSFEFILLIVLGMILGGAALRHLLAHPALERRQAETLRTISEVAIQVIGVLLIVLVFFGPPRETTTMIGLTTAALTIALQDYIIAFLGWFFLVGKYGIRVGDLVEINGVGGEVAEVGLISTTLLETSGLMDKDIPTGRRISFLNGFAIRGQYFNFSTEGQWLRDEITINVPADLDIQSLAKQVEVMVSEEAGENARLAEKEWKHASRTGRLSRLSAASTVNLRPSGSGIDIQVRYVTRAPERSEMRARLYRRVIELLHEKHRPAVPAIG